jgi:hypothetical protein
MNAGGLEYRRKDCRRAGVQWCILIYCKFMTELWRTSIREKREKVREKDPISEPSAVQWPRVPPVTPHQYIYIKAVCTVRTVPGLPTSGYDPIAYTQKDGCLKRKYVGDICKGVANMYNQL